MKFDRFAEKLQVGVIQSDTPAQKAKALHVTETSQGLTDSVKSEPMVSATEERKLDKEFVISNSETNGHMSTEKGVPPTVCHPPCFVLFLLLLVRIQELLSITVSFVR